MGPLLRHSSTHNIVFIQQFYFSNLIYLYYFSIFLIYLTFLIISIFLLFFCRFMQVDTLLRILEGNWDRYYDIDLLYHSTFIFHTLYRLQWTVNGRFSSLGNLWNYMKFFLEFFEIFIFTIFLIFIWHNYMTLYFIKILFLYQQRHFFIYDIEIFF